MAKKMPASQNTEGQRNYRADIAAIDTRLGALRNDLRSALIDGEGTGSLRVKIADLEAGRADIVALLNEAEAKRDQAERADVDATARALANEATTRVSRLLADLRPRGAPGLPA